MKSCVGKGEFEGEAKSTQHGSERGIDITEPLLKERKELSCRNVTTFALCLVVYLCCNLALALFPPFFPLEVSYYGLGI